MGGAELSRALARAPNSGGAQLSYTVSWVQGTRTDVLTWVYVSGTDLQTYCGAVEVHVSWGGSWVHVQYRRTTCNSNTHSFFYVGWVCVRACVCVCVAWWWWRCEARVSIPSFTTVQNHGWATQPLLERIRAAGRLVDARSTALRCSWEGTRCGDTARAARSGVSSAVGGCGGSGCGKEVAAAPPLLGRWRCGRAPQAPPRRAQMRLSPCSLTDGSQLCSVAANARARAINVARGSRGMRGVEQMRFPPPSMHMSAVCSALGEVAAGIDSAYDRVPQSLQSVPRAQLDHSLPGPPSSQSPSVEYDGFCGQLFVQVPAPPPELAQLAGQATATETPLT